VAELVVGGDEGPSSQYKLSGDNIDLNCVALIGKLQNVLQEFRSARSIIALLQEDMNNIHESESTRQPNCVQCGEQIQCESSRKWIPVVSNHNRRPQNSVCHLAKQDDACICTSKEYMLLKNLNDATRPKLSDAAVKNRKSAVAKVKRHRVVLTGDSHIKRCLEKISNLLDDSYNVTGITKPMQNWKP